MYQTKAPLDVKRDEVHKVVHPHALPLYCRKFGIRYSFELSSWMYVLIVDDLPLSDSVVNELFDIRRDVPFSLRAILRVKIRPAEYQKSSGRYQIIEPEPTKSVYDMLPPLSASVVEFERKKTEVPKFDLDEVLANPELDAIKPTHIDPASMLADDIESLTKEGKEFVNNPTLAGAASMAVIAIPGKFLDDVGGHLAKEAFERNPFKTINGRKIINSDLAGQAVKTKGGEVFFDYDGFPDFTPYAEKIVRVPDLTGNRNKDAKLALDVLGMSDYNKKDMVWHHHQDGKTMLLVPKSFHSVPDGVAHTGGSAVIKHNKNNPDNQLTYPSPMEKK